MHRLESLAKQHFGMVLDCEETACLLKLEYGVKLFFKIRVHASLKRFNSETMKKGGKRNKKVMKLMHL